MSGEPGSASPAVGHADDPRMYLVVVNYEEQYSIWPASRELPAGWRAEGTSATRQACLDHIAEAWADIRPLSLRQGENGSSSTHGRTRA
jgi:MbtH protein